MYTLQKNHASSQKKKNLIFLIFLKKNHATSQKKIRNNLKNQATSPKLYRSYYRNRSRELMSLVYGIGFF